LGSDLFFYKHDTLLHSYDKFMIDLLLFSKLIANTDFSAYDAAEVPTFT